MDTQKLKTSPLYEGTDLEALTNMRRYRELITSYFRPYLAGEAIEIGAGIGSMAYHITPHVRSLQLVEPSPNLIETLKARFADHEKVSVINKIWSKAQEWKEMFGKPVHGTDSGDVGRPWDFENKMGVQKYMANVFSSPNRYPAIVFQKFMVDFELNFPQIRLYYLGDKYHHSIVEWKTPYPNGTSRLSKPSDAKFLSKAKTFAKKVLKAVSPFYKGAPKYLTRIDVGCCIQEGKIKPSSLFLNEIEVLAGAYLFYDGERRLNFDYKLGQQAVKVIEHFRKKI